jgi:hypothetical protein
VDAVAAATQVATELGLTVVSPKVLRATNNTVAWLRPSPVVAKITAGSDERLERELAVALSLQCAGAPVVGPSPLVEPLVRHFDRWAMTFWPFVPQDETDGPRAALVGYALTSLHRALDDIGEGQRASLPRWDDELRDLIGRLADASFASPLGFDDRHLLVAALAEHPRITALSAGERVLHGSPHGLNVLMVEGQPRFIDFETVSVGPAEWDLGHLVQEAVASYELRWTAEALQLARFVISAKTAAWCWDGLDRGHDMRFHGEHHLAVVRAVNSEE